MDKVETRITPPNIYSISTTTTTRNTIEMKVGVLKNVMPTRHSIIIIF